MRSLPLRRPPSGVEDENGRVRKGPPVFAILGGNRGTNMAQKHAPAKHDDEEPQETETKAAETTEENAKLADDVDAILDEIEDVLEENAEEFVRNYIQKGGE